MKKILTFLIIALLATVIAAEAGIASTYNIAVVAKDSTSQWVARQGEGIQKFADQTGHNAFQKGPAETDLSAQIQIIRDVMAQGIDALCVVPVDITGIEPVLKEARDEGIVVIVHEGSTVKNKDWAIDAFDNTEFGAFMMDVLAAEMGEEGVYTTMVASVTNGSHNQWADGGIARQKSAYPKMTLLAAAPKNESGDDQERAYEKAKELLKMYPEIKGFQGSSSKDAPGIAKAIEELGLQGKVFVTGVATPIGAKQYIESGTIKAACLWDPGQVGYAMCDLAVKVLDGIKIEEGIDLNEDGYHNIHISSSDPTCLEGNAFMKVTKENVNNYSF
jgi:simple sugar transport system substrate-binding protein